MIDAIVRVGLVYLVATVGGNLLHLLQGIHIEGLSEVRRQVSVLIDEIGASGFMVWWFSFGFYPRVDPEIIEEDSEVSTA